MTAMIIEETRPRPVPVHQPAYLPWPGYFSRLLDADRFVILDHVQYNARSFQNRNYIGRDQRHLLTIPVTQTFGQTIRQVRPADNTWRARHWRSLTHAYGKAAHWRTWETRLEEIYAHPWDCLTSVNMALIQLLLDAFGIEVELLYSSRLMPSGAKTAMLIDLCGKVGADSLVVGEGAPTYLDGTALAEANVSVQIASYNHPAYPRGRHRFLPGLSALDLLLHCGPDARAILQAGAGTRPYLIGAGS